ncbi:nitrate reductase [Glaciibacter flavus]|uniref:Nitrate reductase n=1 Tax=Orlajensenia flava TaxID=2565934 RepID=A0A4S4FVC3_9MICO|nr:cytosine permease [Glaciibacter flavus]THG34258.1 nitrate reductase [Glaciibacter flavus]
MSVAASQAPASAEGLPEIRTDAAGHVEVRGTDHIPADERHGKPRELFWVWLSANVVYLYFVIGGVLVLLGLGIWEALAVTVLGNLWWIAVGWLAVSGPASGTPSVTIMRAMFGVRGNRVFGAGLGVVIGIFFEVINIAFATLATIALLAHLGIGLPPGGEWGVLVVVAALSFGISVYGHATIIKLSPIFTIALAVCFVLLGVFVMQAAHFDYTPAPLSGGDHWGALILGFAVVAANPLSWGTGADYARYLPASVSKRAVMGWTALGGFLPAVLIAALGVFAGTAVDMTDPQLSLAQIVPAWFYPVFLFVIVLGSITNNVLCAYSTGLYFQALGGRLGRTPRAWTVVITGLVATAIAAYPLFIAPNFLDTFNSALELSVTVLGPLVAVYAVDILVRRNRYDGLALEDQSPTSPFWYRAGIYWPGVMAMVIASTLAVLMANTTLYEGPIAQALSGADLSAIAGPVVAGGVYALLWFTTRPYREVTARPTALTVDAPASATTDATEVAA